ncbi:unnamed protein product [Fraxinus pennsylvanica]|uniref:cellulase n=1 Tax=Fraxinus pennsylvanica TaxID=56036 RepID=A0AAD1ZL72_9LAMI|nr:unnamed protein product [Fraxinus pennsylvanica]
MVKLGYVLLLIFGTIFAIILLAGSITIGKLVFPRHHLPTPSNYTVELHKALMFFDAQRSGRLPGKNNVSQKGDSGLDDGQSKSSSIIKISSGGYYYVGDAIKFNFPTSFAMTTFSWSAIEYSAKYEADGKLAHVKDIIKWGTDYFHKTFDFTPRSIDRIVLQVGDGDTSGGLSPNDRYCWTRPRTSILIVPLPSGSNVL